MREKPGKEIVGLGSRQDPMISVELFWKTNEDGQYM